MKILVVSGYLEKVDDGSGIWDIADALENIPGAEAARREWDKLAPADLAGVDLAVVYSYGCAAFWHEFHALPPEQRPTIRQLFIIAGVPNMPDFGQFYGTVWTVPDNILSAMAFNLHGVIPASCGIHNATSFDVKLSDLPNAAITKRMNVTCDGNGVGHVEIQSVEAIQDWIAGTAMEMASALNGQITVF
jgi:hypothetical protein